MFHTSWSNTGQNSSAVRRQLAFDSTRRARGKFTHTAQQRENVFRARGKALSCAGGAAELRHLRHRSDGGHGTGELRLLDYGLSSNELRLSLWGEGGELDILYCIPRERNDG